MTKYLLVLGLGLVMVLGACSGDMPRATEAGPEGMEQAAPYSKPMLPAYETAAEQRIGKADWYDDYRNANLDIYGITAAPGVAIRPMAEWEEAEALIIVYSSSTLPTGIKNNYMDIIAAAKDVVDVHVVYDSTQAYSSLSSLMNQQGIPLSAVTWVNMANDSIWARDFGPMSIFNGSKVGNVDTRYYHQRYNDDAIPTLLVGEDFGQTTYRAPLDYEGGNFMSDTDGTCFASQGLYWFNGTSQANVNSYMEDYLGCQQLHVVTALDGEGTTHIDMQAKILTDNTVVVGEYTYSQDSTNKQILDQNASQIEAAGFNVVRIPMPNNTGGVFRSYTNSLLVNGVHIVPVYSGYSSMQAEAMAIYQQILPGWDHVTSNSDAIIEWSGAIHCITKLVAAGQWTPLEADPEIICDTYDCYPGGSTAGCGDITWQGCCDGNLLQYCENNQLVQQMCNPGTCGWDVQFYNCGTSGGSDPSGQYPKDCDGGCTPDCAGKECGGDGCGGSCGSCTGTETCTNGQCVAPCVPDCAGKECGSNGCGGSCGACGVGEVCSAEGACVPDGECDDITYAGYCDGNTLIWCEDGKLYSADCGLYGSYLCQWVPDNEGYYCVYQSPCEPDCIGKECGDDSCSGSCGTCPEDQICVDGVCSEGPCEPDCIGKECGDDSCSGSCGDCPKDWTCEAGVCEDLTCVPDCVDKACGPDGCGGSCGVCRDDEVCTGGVCVDESEGCPEGTILVDGECIPEGGDGDVIGGGDTGTDVSGKGSSGCAVRGTPQSSSSGIVLLLMMGVLFSRRQRVRPGSY